jgi:hypothetical protein
MRVPDAERVPGVAVTSRRWELSYTQEFLWFLGRRWRESDMTSRFTVVTAEAFHGPIDRQALEDALAAVLHHHEVLRSAITLEQDRPMIVIEDEVAVPLRYHDLSGAPGGEIDELLAGLSGQRVSALEPPPVRFDLVSVSDSLHLLHITAHHLFFDFWSASVLRAQIRRAYEQTLAGTAPEAGGDEPQYVDFAAWQREAAAHPAARHGLDYWVRELADLPLMAMRTDRPRSWTPTSNARRAMLTIPPGLVGRLRVLAHRHHASDFMVLSSLFLALLSEVMDQDDVAIPIVFSGRGQPQTQEMIGYFDNILFLRQRRIEDESVDDLIVRARESALAAYEHNDVPILSVMQRQPRLMLLLADPRNIWTLFHLQTDPDSLAGSVQNFAPPEIGSPGGGTGGPDRSDRFEVEVEAEDSYNFGADLDVTIREADSVIYLRVLYSSDLFDDKSVVELLRRFGHVLERAAADPAQQVASVVRGPEGTDRWSQG